MHVLTLVDMGALARINPTKHQIDYHVIRLLKYDYGLPVVDQYGRGFILDNRGNRNVVRRALDNLMTNNDVFGTMSRLTTVESNYVVKTHWNQAARILKLIIEE